MSAQTRRTPADHTGEGSFSSSHPISSASPGVQAEAIRRWVRNASMADLLDLLADHPFEPGLSGHHWCPSCQRTLSGISRGPGTFVSDGGLSWSCCLCRRTGTLMQAQSMALGRRDAAMRVLDLLAGDDG